MRTRFALVALLALGWVLSSPATALAVSGGSGDGASAEAQYSPPGQETPPLDPLGVEASDELESVGNSGGGAGRQPGSTVPDGVDGDSGTATQSPGEGKSEAHGANGGPARAPKESGANSRATETRVNESGSERLDASRQAAAADASDGLLSSPGWSALIAAGLLGFATAVWRRRQS